MKTKLDAMVDAFLCWRLPLDFAPDGGVHFDKAELHPVQDWPTGTNLLTANQAKSMIEHLLAAAQAENERLREQIAKATAEFKRVCPSCGLLYTEHVSMRGEYAARSAK